MKLNNFNKHCFLLFQSIFPQQSATTGAIGLPPYNYGLTYPHPYYGIPNQNNIQEKVMYARSLKNPQTS